MPADSQEPTVFQQLPPQNIEAEEALLCAILLDSETLLDIVDIVGAQDFYKTAHQKTFQAMINLFDHNEPIDLVTLATKLKENGELNKVGGATFLSKLVDSVPRAVNPVQYAKIIYDKACLRRLIAKSNAIMKRCFDDREPVDEVINFAESSIFEIAENKIRPAFHAVGQIVETNIDLLEERQGHKSIITGVATGFTELDRLTSGLQKSDLIILAARPSMGKTALALNLARYAAIEENIPVAIFSLEMSKEQLTMRLLCSEARVDSSRVRSGYFTSDDWEKLTHAAGVFSESPF